MTLLKKVNSGDPFEPSAREHNVFVDAANAYLLGKERGQRRPRGFPSGSDVVRVRNAHTESMGQYAIARIHDLLLPVETSIEDKIIPQIAFDIMPVANPSDPFVVTTAPLKSSAMEGQGGGPTASSEVDPSEVDPLTWRRPPPRSDWELESGVVVEDPNAPPPPPPPFPPRPHAPVGRAWISGVCPVRLLLTDVNHRFVQPLIGVTTHLASSGSGAAEILWRRPEHIVGEVDWAVIRFGGAGGGNVWGGKVIEVNLHSQNAIVVPIKSTTDPASEGWSNDNNFSMDGAVCCWIMGYTGVQVDQPAIVFTAPNTAKPWMMSVWDITGDNLTHFCPPEGPFATEDVENCEFADEPICLLAPCCLPSGECNVLLKVVCEARGGTFLPQMPNCEKVNCGER